MDCRVTLRTHITQPQRLMLGTIPHLRCHWHHYLALEHFEPELSNAPALSHRGEESPSGAQSSSLLSARPRLGKWLDWAHLCCPERKYRNSPKKRNRSTKHR